MKRENILLIIILLAAGFLRFWQLTDVPPSLSHDEVAIGYNAYSILKTGNDEYGKSFPLLFRSFDDYKLPGMVYVTVPSVAIFGLNELGVRFPSAFLGILSVLIFYLLTKESFGKERKNLPIVSTFFFAISLWHVNFSRQLFESNGSLFFLLIGSFFLFKSLKNNKYIIFSFASFIISIYFYYSVRLIIPFILICFFIMHRKKIISNMKMIVIAIFVSSILILPLLPSLLSSEGFARLNIVSVANDKNYVERKEDFTKIIAENPNFVNKIIYNRRVALLITASENYLKNLSPQYVFFSGTGSMGLLHIFEIPFFILGMYFILKLKSTSKWFFAIWILAVPLTGAFSTDQPNFLRTLPNAPMFSLLSALGFIGILNIFKNRKVQVFIVMLFSLMFIFSLSQFIKVYFYESFKNNSISFGDGYKQMVNYVRKNENKYDQIYISGEYWRPYIFTLFWKKYDPALFQALGDKDRFDKYHFSRAQWDDGVINFADENFDFQNLQEKNKKILFILSEREYKIHEFRFNKIDTINGKYAKNVFTAAVLR